MLVISTVRVKFHGPPEVMEEARQEAAEILEDLPNNLPLTRELVTDLMMLSYFRGGARQIQRASESRDEFIKSVSAVRDMLSKAFGEKRAKEGETPASSV